MRQFGASVGLTRADFAKIQTDLELDSSLAILPPISLVSSDLVDALSEMPFHLTVSVVDGLGSGPFQASIGHAVNIYLDMFEQAKAMTGSSSNFYLIKSNHACKD